MLFIPPVIPYQSPAARDLAAKLTAVIREFKASHPELSSRDVNRALRIAERDAGGLDSRRLTVLAAAGVAALVAMLGLFISRAQAGGEGSDFPILLVLVGLAIVGLLAGFAVLRR